MSTSLKKLWNDYGIGAIVIFIIILYVLSMLYKYFAAKGNYGYERLSQNNNNAYGSSNVEQTSNKGVQPSEPLGQNEVFSSVNYNKSSGPGIGVPMSCNTKSSSQNPSDLLPKDNNSQWAQLNPVGKGDLANINLLKAGYHIGIDTIGQTLRNANLQIRSEPPNPQINVGPWNLSTIEPDFMRPPLELGQGTQ
jgi:hypothetical protein